MFEYFSFYLTMFFKEYYNSALEIVMKKDV
jgi:hypothetical protein